MSNQRKYKFGDYCLEPIKAFIRSYSSFDALYEILKKKQNDDIINRIKFHLYNSIENIDLFIREAKSLRTTLILIGEHLDTITIMELDDNIAKIEEIKKDIKKHLLYN